MSLLGEKYIAAQLESVLQSLDLPAETDVKVYLERPKSPEHGDLATNIAMSLASPLRRNPREIAKEIVGKLNLDKNIVAEVEIAGAGFINFRLQDQYYRNGLQTILSENENFGRSDSGKGKKVQFEFVSANPTGPLNVVSARAATVGDVLANLFNTAGYETHKEFYVNDAGRQVRLLGESVSARYMDLVGQKEDVPEEGYHGDYVIDLARDILEEHGDGFASATKKERIQKFKQIALAKILSSQQETLHHYRVEFDNWFRESELRSNKVHLQILERLQQKGMTYEEEGAQWFKSSELGDEKDRVLITKKGEPTYFLVDIAYHVNKYERGFEQLYDLWGPDHHGYIDRMKGALIALGYGEGSFEVSIIQQVNLFEQGELVKMSKRAGRIIEMKELIEEVGVDVARYFFLTRRNQSPLDFDMDLAKNTSEENPVFYVQYAHARICNIIKHAGEQGVPFPESADLELLQADEEMTLVKKLFEYQEIISKAVTFLEPHRIPNYLQELAAAFHRFYHHHRVVSEDVELTKARLILTKCTQIVLRNALTLLGVTAPEKM